MGVVWQRAVVFKVDHSSARVRFERLQHCQQCLSGKGCGAGVFSRLFSRRSAELNLKHVDGLEVGQVVQVGVDEAELLRVASQLYGLPLMAFILAAVATASLVPAGWVEDVLSLGLGLFAAVVAVWVTSRMGWNRLNPDLKVLSSPAGGEVLESGLHEDHI
jgi:sigma-E factor negative regulatory protein RseC